MHTNKSNVPKSAAKLVNAPLGNGKAPMTKKPAPQPQKWNAAPDKFTYALGSYTAERRTAGWFVTKTSASTVGEKPKWSGPFADIENACLSIARHLFVELADRHTRSIEAHKISPADPLFGLKPTTKLRAR
jgi:hypothetical protein